MVERKPEVQVGRYVNIGRFFIQTVKGVSPSIQLFSINRKYNVSAAFQVSVLTISLVVPSYCIRSLS